MERLVVGCMTGTSIDALDAALVRVHGRGLEMTAEFVRGVTRPLGELAAPLRRLAEQGAMTAGEIARLSREFSLLHVGAVRELVASGGEKIDLVCVHGQTVFHGPPASWQLLAPAVIAQGLGVAVVSDLRAADLACGGQGAPITPMADLVLFGDPKQRRAVINLGGFCNVTILSGEGDELGEFLQGAGIPVPQDRQAMLALPARVKGFDVCACNLVLDLVARRVLGVPFDEDGRIASSGEVDSDAEDDLQAVLIAQSRAGRSLGTGDEVMSWVGRHWRGGAGLSGPNLAASACEAIAQVIAKRVGARDQVILAGGGARNKALVEAIFSCGLSRVTTTADYGVPIEFREAVCFAVLGALCQDRVPITLSAVTGVKTPPMAGTWVMP